MDIDGSAGGRGGRKGLITKNGGETFLQEHAAAPTGPRGAGESLGFAQGGAAAVPSLPLAAGPARRRHREFLGNAEGEYGPGKARGGGGKGGLGSSGELGFGILGVRHIRNSSRRVGRGSWEWDNPKSKAWQSQTSLLDRIQRGPAPPHLLLGGEQGMSSRNCHLGWGQPPSCATPCPESVGKRSMGSWNGLGGKGP